MKKNILEFNCFTEETKELSNDLSGVQGVVGGLGAEPQAGRQQERRRRRRRSRCRQRRRRRRRLRRHQAQRRRFVDEERHFELGQTRGAAKLQRPPAGGVQDGVGVGHGRHRRVGAPAPITHLRRSIALRRTRKLSNWILSSVIKETSSSAISFQIEILIRFKEK